MASPQNRKSTKGKPRWKKLLPNQGTEELLHAHPREFLLCFLPVPRQSTFDPAIKQLESLAKHKSHPRQVTNSSNVSPLQPDNTPYGLAVGEGSLIYPSECFKTLIHWKYNFTSYSREKTNSQNCPRLLLSKKLIHIILKTFIVVSSLCPGTYPLHILNPCKNNFPRSRNGWNKLLKIAIFWKISVFKPLRYRTKWYLP